MTLETINKLKKLFPTKSPAFSITSDGRIIAVTEIPLSSDEIKALNIGRFDAFENMSDVLIPYTYASTISDLFEDHEGWIDEIDDSKKEVIDTINDTVNHIQYQAMIEWAENFMKNSPRNPDGSFKID